MLTYKWPGKIRNYERSSSSLILHYVELTFFSLYFSSSFHSLKLLFCIRNIHIYWKMIVIIIGVICLSVWVYSVRIIWMGVIDILFNSRSGWKRNRKRYRFEIIDKIHKHFAKWFHAVTHSLSLFLSLQPFDIFTFSIKMPSITLLWYWI